MSKTRILWDDVKDVLNEQLSTINEQKITIDELMTDHKKLKKENEQLRKQVDNLQDALAEFCANLLMNGFGIEVVGENLRELFDNE